MDGASLQAIGADCWRIGAALFLKKAIVGFCFWHDFTGELAVFAVLMPISIAPGMRFFLRTIVLYSYTAKILEAPCFVWPALSSGCLFVILAIAIAFRLSTH